MTNAAQTERAKLLELRELFAEKAKQEQEIKHQTDYNYEMPEEAKQYFAWLQKKLGG